METPLTRRTAIKGIGAVAMASTAIELAGPLAHIPDRGNAAGAPSDIQFDIEAVTAPPLVTDTGLRFAVPPVHTIFLTAALGRTPTRADRAELIRALNALESSYPFDAAHLITFVSYGLPYFRRLPGGLDGALVASRMPRLANNTSRYVLEEAVPGPTDVGQPGITKVRFNVPVRIEQNDLLFTFRSDNFAIIQDVLAWFSGSGQLRNQEVPSPAFAGLLTFTSSRYMFVQRGLPRAVAQQNRLPFANFIQPQSPMWMGFADQQVDAAGPPPICTFAGNSSAKLTTAKPGDYFDNGSIHHLSHLILDMLQFFDMASETSAPGNDGVFTERVQYVFHSPPIHPGFADQLTDGGGPAFLPNRNFGANYAQQTAQGIGVEEGTHRMGHLSTLQRSSRAADGTPVHLRMDGPGFDTMDVPDDSRQPKLQFTIFVPTADFFATMRRNQASLDLQKQFDVDVEENGLERFLTATRRQNFLIPPRRNRAFPLLELT